MRLSWSFLRLVLGLGGWVMGAFLLEQATGEQSEVEIARSLGVADVNDWDIRSLYRVRFQHVTKRPPPGLRAVERKSKLATRWAALRERIADLLPSRHTNPRTVVTFDKIATDFVNVGIVKLAKALDPPKSVPKSRTGKKAKVTTPEPERAQEVSGEEADVTNVPAPTKPSRPDGRPKRRVTLLVDLPDFDLQDFAGSIVEEDAGEEHRRTEPPSPATSPYPFLPEPAQRLVADGPCSGGVAQMAIPKWLILVATFLSLWGTWSA
uniref:LEM domain-containing protein n=1 Tax=Anopheles farauti TaxID=69004 RepID=A0A182R0I9_9DIPT